jgi:TonB family protein
VSANKTDISQIRKYLNGELDARAMHQLERAAQDDPFLMDALEGYENTAADQQLNLADLDHRLQQRIDQNKVRRLIPWKYYAAAASVLIVFTLGYLLWPANKPPVSKNLVAAKIQPPAPTFTEPLEKPNTADLIIEKPEQMAASTPPKAARSSVSQAEMKQAAADVQPAANQAMKVAEPATEAYDAKAVIKADTVTYAASPYNSRARKSDSSNTLKEISIRGYGAQKKELNANAGITSQPLQGKLFEAQVTTPSRISGTIMDEMGVPLPGVNVKIAGTSVGTSTDMNGRFSLSAKDKEVLDINYVGYTSKRVEAQANNNLKIALSQDSRSLSEVVVTRVTKIKPVKEAHPQMGWDQYNKYLKERAVADDTQTGTVRLSFTVGLKGTLSDFKIIKGLSPAINQQAIDLVKDGPVWAPDADGKPKTIKLKIRFSKQ